jgi:hypothetical protein
VTVLLTVYCELLILELLLALHYILLSGDFFSKYAYLFSSYSFSSYYLYISSLYSTLVINLALQNFMCFDISHKFINLRQNLHLAYGFLHSIDSCLIYSYLSILLPHPSHIILMKLHSSNSCVPNNSSSYDI